MSRTLVGVCTAIVLSAAMLGAQSQSPDSGAKASGAGKSSSANAATVTFTGCVNPGSSPDSFYLLNAKQKGVKSAATTVKLVPATKKVDVGTFVTQGVEVIGTLDQTAAAPASAAGAASAPTLTVTKIKSNAGGC